MRAFEPRTDLTVDANELAQFRRRPDAVLVFRSRKKHFEQVPNSVTLFHCAGWATSMATGPLFHDEPEESVDVRQQPPRQARKVH